MRLYAAGPMADEGREMGWWEVTCRTENDLYLVAENLSKEAALALQTSLNEIEFMENLRVLARCRQERAAVTK